MEIPINAQVFCIDGLCGHSTRVILRRLTEEVTHIVVKIKTLPHDEFLVPVTAVTSTTPNSIQLSLNRNELDDLKPFTETEYVEMNIPEYAGGAYALDADFYLSPEVIGLRHEKIPKGELAVGVGARVEASDGHVGKADEFLVDEETGRVTHLVMREGHLWGKREVTIPISAIDRLGEHTIYLKLTKEKVEELAK
jgi:hypothetical protein